MQLILQIRAVLQTRGALAGPRASSAATSGLTRTPGLVARVGQGTGQGVQGVASDGLGVVPGVIRKASRPPSSLWWLSAARAVVLTRLPKPLASALFWGFPGRRR